VVVNWLERRSHNDLRATVGRPLVADQTSGNSTEAVRSEPIEGPQSPATSVEPVLEDEYTRADRGQTLADTDQTLSDSDQSAADSDQSASERDQEASDRELELGGDPVAYDAARDVRERGSLRREEAARERIEAAAARDAVAKARDLEAAERDRLATELDRELAARDAAWASDPDAQEDDLRRTGKYRALAAADRLKAFEARTRAAADREQAARDRARAAEDRQRAQREHTALLQQLAIAETDQLTGARTRAAGLADLEHEIDRARRTSGRLAVGYIDVVGLKKVNDERGHSAGDTLLKHAVHAIRSHLRSYDLIVRMGGDEFLFVMSDASIETASRRFAAIQKELESDPDPCAVRLGVAALTTDDSVAALIERADRELPAGNRS